MGRCEMGHGQDSRSDSTSDLDSHRFEARFKQLFRHTFWRLILVYFAPLLLLAVFFNLQHASVVEHAGREHLRVIAEHQANTMDLFLRERLVNLTNVLGDSVLSAPPPSGEDLDDVLSRLQQASGAFVDVGLVDERGRLVAYAGPVDYPDVVSYESEAWFELLRREGRDWVMTDIYLGLRQEPHFTIAVKRRISGAWVVLRAALSPEFIHGYLTTLEGANEVRAALANAAGVLQIAGQIGTDGQPSSYTPPQEPDRGYFVDEGDPETKEYGYAWLAETPWVLVVESKGDAQVDGTLLGRQSNVFWLSLGLSLLTGVLVLWRARQVVRKQVELELHEAELSRQLVHAARLASVGELAAGIAHEINNPLAIIAEEVGLMRDALDPEFADDEDDETDPVEHLTIIKEAVFRCRDITRKLLTFVRQSDVKFERQSVHEILDEVAGGMLGNQLSLSNIEVITEYDERIPPVLTDRNRLIQVFVNLIKNALDAMPNGGRLTIRTSSSPGWAKIEIRDSGSGMTPEQMKRIFHPFFTTKDPGKGTGLGLSVCSTIVEGFGGGLSAASDVGEGSTFVLELPVDGPNETDPRHHRGFTTRG